MDTITPVAEYIEGHLQRINSGLLSDGDFLSLLGGEGGVQVDAVFYLVSNRTEPQTNWRELPLTQEQVFGLLISNTSAN